MHIVKNYLTCLALLLLLLPLQPLFSQPVIPVFETTASKVWADSVYEQLNYEQKIGQLFMVDAYSNRDTAHVNTIAALIRSYHIGGIIFFQGGPVRQALHTNYYQSISKVPLLVGIDGEWGLSMRLDSTIRFPRQMTLGATHNDSLIYSMAREIGRQCQRMGIHLNFAPVADINNNPLNPVISSRSFGEVKERVTASAVQYLNGLQDFHVMACGKHFPGHGNTDSDSHFTLPVINQTSAEIDSVELYPFRELIKQGVASMMVAHLFIPAYDTINNLAATLSKNITTGLLKDKLGFRGLVFTDALNMKGVADYYPSGELELKALQAGNDVLLYSANIPAAWMRIHYAIQNCEIDQETVDASVKKILMSKYWSGLSIDAHIDTTNLIRDLNTPDALYLTQSLYENAITLVKNDQLLIPIGPIERGRVASVVINDTLNNPFQEMIRNYCDVTVFNMPKDISAMKLDSLAGRLSEFEYVILSIHNTSTKATSQYGISEQTSTLISRLQPKVKLINVVFGNAYTLTRIPANLPGTFVLAYEDTYWPQHFAAQAVFGAARLNGKIPVTAGNGILLSMGIPMNDELLRLRFTSPMEVGISEKRLSVIDSIALRAINDKAIPGCQVAVAWKGKVIYQKSFGNFLYSDSLGGVSNTDLYDIASVTKIAATALAVMKLYEEGEIDIDKKASKYLHELRKTNKKDLLISDILTHQAGLKAWIPFWKQTLEDGKPAYNIYHPEKDVNYSIPLADSMYILNSYSDKLWEEIYESPVNDPGKYEYSDLGMLIMQKVVEEVTEQPFEAYLEKHFYSPLGLHRLLFNPLERYDKSIIVPTEMDTVFRRTLIHGYVHDPVAAMLGGVAGNAGLFSDAGSVAVIMQMLLNKGLYGGKRYLKPETVEFFTKKFHAEGANRRGLIFDKPEPDISKNGPTAASASPTTFGHSGFTGTTAWADPANDLVYVFLSNRVYPTAANNRLAKGNYRTDIMQAVYEIIQDPFSTKR
ncbi:MAG: serine hydrolase [Bacteroidota bacterium]|nr:serine hydrolase [Bacteroidota bacterium]